MSEKKCCRACLKEIRNRGSFTNLLHPPKPSIHLRKGPATSYLHCYYFCLRPNTVTFNIENVPDYSYICGTCKGIMLKSIDFIIQSQKNEAFLMSMYDIRKDESIADCSDTDSVSLDYETEDMHFNEEQEESKSDFNQALIENYEESEIFEHELEEVEIQELEITSEVDNIEFELMDEYSLIKIEEQYEESREVRKDSNNEVLETRKTPENVSMKEVIYDKLDEIKSEKIPEKDDKEKDGDSYDELEEIIKAARKKVLRSKKIPDWDCGVEAIKGTSNNFRKIAKILEVDNKKWKAVPKESFHLEFKCLLCRKNFQLQRLLFEHYDKEHDQSTLTFPCDICKKRHISQKALTFHKHSVHNNVEYEDCDLCGQVLLPTFFKAHKERHKAAVQYACTKCDRVFDRLCTLKQHHRAIHEKEKLRRYECPDCDRHFFSEENLNSHRMAHDENNAASLVEFLCHICSKTFPRKNDLQLHLKVHSGNIIKCPHCSKEFVRPKDMEYHMRSHTKDFPFKCNICSRGFAVRWNLDAHIKKHEGLRYKCKICSKEYIHLSGLRDHTYQHLGYPLTCKLCGKGYAVKKKLRSHLKNAHRKRFEDENSDSTIDGYMLRHRVQNLFDAKVEFMDEFAA